MRLAAVLAFTCLTAVAARADDVWIPLADGKSWTYAVKVTSRAVMVNNTKQGVATATCAAAEGGLHQLTWRLEDGENRIAWLSSDATGVTIARSSSDKLILLPFNRLDAGPITGSGVSVNGRPLAMNELAVRGMEKVTTPHGQYDALRVDATSTAPATKVRTSVWYARGIGPVKIVQVSEAPATKVERELLLKEISGGGATPAQGGGATPPPAQGGGAPPPPTQGGGTTPPPAQGGAAPASGAGLAALVRDAASKGLQADLTALRALAAEVLRRAEKAGNKKLAAAATSWATQSRTLQPTVARRVEQLGGFDGAVVVCDGDVEVMGAVSDSVIFCTGEVDVAGGVSDSLIICVKDLNVAGTLDGSVVAAKGQLDVAGSLSTSIVQAKSVDNAGTRTNVTVVSAGPEDLLTPVQ